VVGRPDDRAPGTGTPATRGSDRSSDQWTGLTWHLATHTTPRPEAHLPVRPDRLYRRRPRHRIRGCSRDAAGRHVHRRRRGGRRRTDLTGARRGVRAVRGTRKAARVLPGRLVLGSGRRPGRGLGTVRARCLGSAGALPRPLRGGHRHLPPPARNHRVRAVGGSLERQRRHGSRISVRAGRQQHPERRRRAATADVRPAPSCAGVDRTIYITWNIAAGTGGIFTPYIIRTLHAGGQAASVGLSAAGLILSLLGTVFIFMRLVDRGHAARKRMWGIGGAGNRHPAGGRGPGAPPGGQRGGGVLRHAEHGGQVVGADRGRARRGDPPDSAHLMPCRLLRAPDGSLARPKEN
jgi:hypothetical protein